MSTKIDVKYLEHAASLSPGETVLDALEKAGAPVPSSCRAGACQSCMLRAVSGDVPASSQEGLPEALRLSGHFLSCVCRPTGSLVCEPARSAPFQTFVSVQNVRHIGPEVVRVRFARPAGFEFNPGQFVTLRRKDGVGRSYSLASCSRERDHFDIHVRRVNNGRLSTWFHDEAGQDDQLWLEGPKGSCMYYPGKPEEPLTLIGTGTGVAPLFAIANEALQQGHTGPIELYHGALTEDRFYLVDELSALSGKHGNFSYKRCVVKGPTLGQVIVGDLKEIVESELSDAQRRRIYLCGDPGLVRVMKRHLFLAGVSLSRIHSDPFVGTETKHWT